MDNAGFRSLKSTLDLDEELTHTQRALYEQILKVCRANPSLRMRKDRLGVFGRAMAMQPDVCKFAFKSSEAVRSHRATGGVDPATGVPCLENLMATLRRPMTSEEEPMFHRDLPELVRIYQLSASGAMTCHDDTMTLWCAAPGTEVLTLDCGGHRREGRRRVV